MVQRVCWRCIGEELVSAEIKAENPRRVCSYCGSRREAIKLEDLARRVDPVFREVVGSAEEGFRMVDGEPAFGPLGEYPSQLMTEILSMDDEEIGRDLVALLARQHERGPDDGGYDYYDDTSDRYAIVDRADDWVRRGWEAFCDELKHRRRFFIERAGSMLDELLGPIVRGEWPAGGAIRAIGPETEHRHVYRGRLANDADAQRAIYASRRSRLSAPAPGLAGAGRMNAAGISVFYGSFDLDTCIAELRTPVGGFAIVGRFEILSPLRVLDLTLLEDGFEPLSYFDPEYAQMMSYQAFMIGFHQEVRKAVLPGQEPLEYLPTQVIAEYLWTRAEPPLDGLIFGSAQITGSSSNIVLFPHASVLEGAEDEPERTIAHVYQMTPREEEDEEIESVAFRPLAEAVPEGRERLRGALDEARWLEELMGAAEPAVPAGANLRLGDEDVWRVRVDGIRYDTHPIPARFEEWEDAGY